MCTHTHTHRCSSCWLQKVALDFWRWTWSKNVTKFYILSLHNFHYHLCHSMHNLHGEIFWLVFWFSQLLAICIGWRILCEHWVWSFKGIWASKCHHSNTIACSSWSSNCKPSGWRMEVCRALYSNVFTSYIYYREMVFQMHHYCFLSC